MYELIAVDMDGTLLNHKKEISSENQKAIAAARAVGKKVVIATGRPLVGIRRYLEQLNMVTDEDYVIAFNGALVQTAQTGRVIAMKTLTWDDYQDLYTVSLKLGVHIHALTERHVTTPVANPYTDVEAEINLIETEILPVGDVPRDYTIVNVL